MLMAPFISYVEYLESTSAKEKSFLAAWNFTSAQCKANNRWKNGMKEWLEKIWGKSKIIL
jgi:hypothetical protein